MAQREYPYDEGEVTVLGPETFVGQVKLENGAEGNVISYKGDNYYPINMANMVLAQEKCREVGHDWDVIQYLGADVPSHVSCGRCGAGHAIVQPAQDQEYVSPGADTLDDSPGE